MNEHRDVSPRDSVTLHSSWKGIMSGVLGAGLLAGIGLWGTIVTGGAGFPLVILMVGGALLLGVLLDYPVASTFDADAVVRRAPLRRHRIEWDRVRQLTRTRPGLSAGLRQLDHGGLVAVVGRRRYLLVDQCEAIAEYERVIEVLDDRTDGLGFDDLIVPRTTTEPTWANRRKHWIPDQ